MFAPFGIFPFAPELLFFISPHQLLSESWDIWGHNFSKPHPPWTVSVETEKRTRASKLLPKREEQEALTGSTWLSKLCPYSLFPTLLSLLPLWYLCIGSCRGDRTHKHCSRQEVPWNHNGVTAALRSRCSHCLCLPQPACMLLSLASCMETTALRLALISLIIISMAFSAVAPSALGLGKSLSDLRCLEWRGVKPMCWKTNCF